VKSLEEGLALKPDVIVFDMVHAGELADDLRKKGHLVVGGSVFQDLLEQDRLYAIRLCEKMGITVPPYQEFKKQEIEKAIEFVANQGKRYVLKPNGDVGSLALDLTYVSKDPEDMIHQLEWLKDEGNMKVDFILQEFIEGIEVSTECWFSKGRYVGPPNGTIEVKKLMAGNKGPVTGCESSVVWRYGDDSTKIVQETIAKLYPLLQEMKYTGPLDMNCEVMDGKAYFLEFTPRFGYSAVYGFLDLLEDDFGETLYHMAKGDAEEMNVSDDLSFVLTLSSPPYPLWHDKAKEVYKDLVGKKMLNVPDEAFWPHDVYYDEENDCYCLSGFDGLAGFLSYAAPSIEEAKDAVYQMAGDIDLSDIQYRIDGTDRFEEDIPELEAMGFEVPVNVMEEL